jgi:exodeoxyribonuclease VII large subunit
MLAGMGQFSFMGLGDSVLSVGDLTRYLRQLLETDYRLQDVTVRGEASNVSRPASGHLYFTLKDSEASLRCVMWRPQVDRQRVLPRDGESVEVHGHISVYEAGGQYQLYADMVRHAGEGNLYRAFLELKDKLQAEGLFDPERKRPLPAFPGRIGIITSPTGAALQDALDVLSRRFPLAEVVLSPSQVQGADAPLQLVQAFALLRRADPVDVVLLIRGGGSLEDLAAFNDEAVARAVADSQVPVVSGVGHETDFTIVDFVADLRAPTPSAAAEMVSPDRVELAAGVRQQRMLLASALRGRLDSLGRGLSLARAALRRASPRARLDNNRQRVDELTRRGQAALVGRLKLERSRLAGTLGTLRAVGPPAVLARGFAVVRDRGGEVIRSVVGLEPDDQVSVRLSDGSFGAHVDSVSSQSVDDGSSHA